MHRKLNEISLRIFLLIGLNKNRISIIFIHYRYFNYYRQHVNINFNLFNNKKIVSKDIIINKINI